MLAEVRSSPFSDIWKIKRRRSYNIQIRIFRLLNAKLNWKLLRAFRSGAGAKLDIIPAAKIPQQ